MKTRLLLCLIVVGALAVPVSAGDKAVNWFGQGKAYYKEKRYHAAIDAFSQAIKDNDANSSYYHWRGYAYYKLASYDAALQDFDRAISLKKDHVDYFYIRGLTRYKQGAYRQAITDFNQGVTIDERHQKGGLFFWRARARSRLGADKRTVDDYSRALELGYTGRYDVYVERGLAHETLEMLREALQDLRIAMELKPKRSKAWLNYGAILYSLKRYTPAERAFERVLQLDPENGEANVYMALIDLIMGRYGDAEKRFEAALNDRRERRFAIHNLASVYLLTNRPERCSSFLLDGLSEFDVRRDNYVYASILAYYSLLKQGRLDQGQAVLTKALREADSAAAAYALLRYLKGEMTASELLAAHPDEQWLWTTGRAVIGLAHLYGGRRSAAVDYLRQAVRQGEPAPFSTLALLNYRNIVAEDPQLREVVPAAIYFEPDPVRQGEVGRLVAEYVPFPGQERVTESWTIVSPSLTSPPLKKTMTITLDHHRQEIPFRIPGRIEPGLYELHLQARFAGERRRLKGQFAVSRDMLSAAGK